MGQIIGNCHKLPASNFKRRLLTSTEIEGAIKSIYSDIYALNKNCTSIFTVSPVRHVRDGFIQNNWSKARLLDACHSFVETMESSNYFPSYEIMMDELRDYRFYASDRNHPSDEASNYIFSKFLNCYFYSVQKDTIKLIRKINKNLQHRSTNADGSTHKDHLEKTNKLIDQLQQEHSLVYKIKN